MSKSYRWFRLALVCGASSLLTQGCAKPQQPPPVAAAPANTCRVDTDCTGAGSMCKSGQCVAAPVCLAGETLKDGACVKSTELASRSMDLPPGCDAAALKAPIRFAFDSSTLDADSKAALDARAKCLVGQTIEVVIEGHADERGTQEYNLALGERRASTVRDYLGRLGIKKDGLRTLSKGENEPVCGEHTEDCWAKNRRIEWTEARASTASGSR
jgi:peptidoglycan-associated lipoprotein